MASVSEASICSKAFRRFGEDEVIVTLTGTSRLIRLANEFYNDTRDALLRKYRWKFAIKRESITADPTAPVAIWSYRYRIPGDCLRVLSVNEYDSGEFEHTGVNPIWDREGEFIVTNELGPIKIRYIEKVTDPDLFDACFVETLAAAIAVKVGPSLRDSSDTTDLRQEFEEWVADARRSSAIEGRPHKKQRYASDWLYGG